MHYYAYYDRAPFLGPDMGMGTPGGILNADGGGGDGLILGPNIPISMPMPMPCSGSRAATVGRPR